MAKSIRSKVKKRLRTVKRGVVKRELGTAGSKLNVREVAKEARLAQALTGDIRLQRSKRNAFRADDPDAVIPQHNWRQGPDFRAAATPDSGYALVGANRPKLGSYGGDAPSARAVLPPGQQPAATGPGTAAAADPGLQRLLRSTEQIVPFLSSKRAKKKLKNKGGVDHEGLHKARFV
jgi:hypothetical protein